MDYKNEVTLVIGSQYGNEGKGRISSYLCNRDNFNMAARVGSYNSGHTIHYNNEKIVLRHIPAGVTNNNTTLYLSRGMLIHPQTLLTEINMFKLNPNRVKVDKFSAVIEEEYILREKQNKFLEKEVGSTLSGVGEAYSDRILRKAKLMKDIKILSEYQIDTVKEINSRLNNGDSLIVEGSQGFGLSLYHGDYPYVTSRDTTTSEALSSLGLSPQRVKEVYLVVRCRESRVGPGRLYQEETNSNIKEYSSITKRLRRVGGLDVDLIKNASIVNGATKIALTFTDYISMNNEIDRNVQKTINFIEEQTNVKVALLTKGPNIGDIIDLEK